jgi:hypothetical protein
MNENNIIAALLTVAANASHIRESGVEHLDHVLDDYEYLLKKLTDNQAASLPKAVHPMLDGIRKKREARQKP